MRRLRATILATGGIELTAASRAELDITQPDQVAAAVAGHDLVLNTAAFTDVDAAEAREAEATAVNGDAVATLAAACARAGARLVQVSTDYVFPDDHFGTGYVADLPGTGAARCNPVNAPKHCEKANLSG